MKKIRRGFWLNIIDYMQAFFLLSPESTINDNKTVLKNKQNIPKRSKKMPLKMLGAEKCHLRFISLKVDISTLTDL